MTHRAIALIVLFGAIALNVCAQTPARDTPALPAGAGIIRGHVLADATGEPLRRARVVVSGRLDADSIFTNESGEFIASGLPPGSYTLLVSAARKRADRRLQ